MYRAKASLFSPRFSKAFRRNVNRLFVSCFSISLLSADASALVSRKSLILRSKEIQRPSPICFSALDKPEREALW